MRNWRLRNLNNRNLGKDSSLCFVLSRKKTIVPVWLVCPGVPVQSSDDSCSTVETGDVVFQYIFSCSRGDQLSRRRCWHQRRYTIYILKKTQVKTGRAMLCAFGTLSSRLYYYCCYYHLSFYQYRIALLFLMSLPRRFAACCSVLYVQLHSCNTPRLFKMFFCF